MTWLQDTRTGHIGAQTGELPGGDVVITLLEPSMVVYMDCAPVEALGDRQERHKPWEMADVTGALAKWGQV